MKKVILGYIISLLLLISSIGYTNTDIVSVAQTDNGYVYVVFYYQNMTGYNLSKFEAKLIVHETVTGKIWTRTKVYSDGLKIKEKKTYSIYGDFGKYIYGNAEVMITDGWKK